MNFFILIISFLILLSNATLAEDTLNLSDNPEYQSYPTQDSTTYFYKKPGGFDFITNIPQDYINFYNDAFTWDNTLEISLITVSTAAMIVYDQPMLDEVQKVGRNWGIGNGDNTKTMLSLGGYPIFRGPTDLGSAMYFLGDGWTHIGLGASFLTYGLISDDNRAIQTASQLAQGMLTTGIATQFLKHITGRESPMVSTRDAGRWVFFPNQIEYHKKVPHFDAFPSGHLATAMMTVTVIADNYPEYYFIRPLGYTLMTILSLQMMNNAVHWISDYPLAIGIGYIFAKSAVRRGRVEIKKGKDSRDLSWYKNVTISPGFNMFGGIDLRFQYIIE